MPEGKEFGRRPAGKQRGAKGKWRDQPLRAERTIPHYPEQCSACNAPLGVEQREEKPHRGDYPFELTRQEQGFSIECRLHHYYGATCACGHHSQAKPAQGDCSEVTGRKVQLSLQEQVLIGPMLATFIASLSVRYRLSRVKIQEFLNDWQAVVAFVSPHLPVTNNEAERALRHAVIARHITPGTRSAEGSDAYAALLTVIETCRRRNLSPSLALPV